MGWWATGHADDVIGDDAADSLVGALRFYARMTKSKPTFQELLDATYMVLRTDGDGLLADHESLGPLEAVFDSPAQNLVSHEVSVDALMMHLSNALQEITQHYDLAVHRKPRLSEILEVTAFPLRARAGQFLRDAEGLTLKELRVRR
jgi:hypothetical protein